MILSFPLIRVSFGTCAELEGQKRAQKQTLAYHLGAPTKAAKL